jgi:hypothetical protein
MVLEDSETLKVTKDESSHGEIANIKNNSSSSNNFITNSSHTGVFVYNIIVSNNANSNKNMFSNKNRNIINSNDSSKFHLTKGNGTLKYLEIQGSPQKLYKTP